MGDAGPALLREARHVEHRAALALDMRGHAEQRADRDHARAADAGDEDAVRLGRIRQLGLRQGREQVGRSARLARRPGLAELAALDGDEAREKAVQAGIVLVAGGLVDGALARSEAQTSELPSLMRT